MGAHNLIISTDVTGGLFLCFSNIFLVPPDGPKKMTSAMLLRIL